MGLGDLALRSCRGTRPSLRVSGPGGLLPGVGDGKEEVSGKESFDLGGFGGSSWRSLSVWFPRAWL